MADENNMQNGEQQQIDPQKLKELLELADALKKANLLDEKLEADALDGVAGGTVGELDDLGKAFGDRWKQSGVQNALDTASAHVPGVNQNFADNLTEILHDIGITANIDLGWGGTGIGSKANTYVSRGTGKPMTHEEVLKFVRDGWSWEGLD